jgi:hypothetical protein
MAADDDDVLPPGLAPEGENDDDIREDAAALFGIQVGDDHAPIDLDGGGGAGATATGTTIGSNSTPSDAGNCTSGGKRTSPVWDDFDKIFETVDGKHLLTKATCKMCKSTLSARTAAGTGHLKRHQKACKEKMCQRARVQSRLALNPDGLHN